MPTGLRAAIIAAAVAGAVLPGAPSAQGQEDDRYVAVNHGKPRPAPGAGLLGTLFGRAPLPRVTYGNTYDPMYGTGDRYGSYGYRGPDDGFGDEGRDRGSRRSGGPASICVRTCDGFYFPVGGYEPSLRDSVCQSSCPDGDAAVFEGSSVDDAYDAGGRRYGDLPNAFLFRVKRVDQCTCRRNPGDPAQRASITTDPTLRRGDIYTTETTALVFMGSRGGVHGRGDFVPFDAKGVLPKNDVSRLAAMLGQTREALLAQVGQPVGNGARARRGQAAAEPDADLPSIVVTRPPRAAPVLAREERAPGQPRVVLPRAGEGTRPAL